MTTSRLPRRRGDGSAVVDGWVAVYTLGLPAPMRARRREELSGFLDDERADAVRRGEVGTLRRRRIGRWILGIPDDLLWRLTDARAVARTYPRPAWIPVSRWALALLLTVAFTAACAVVLVVSRLIEGAIAPTDWPAPGPAGFVAGCVLVTLGTLGSIPWPRGGAAVTTLGALIGFAVSPWLWGCWSLAVIAVAVRLVQADRLQPTR